MSTNTTKKIDLLGVMLRILVIVAVALAALLVVLRFDEIREYGFWETLFPSDPASETATRAATLEFSADSKNVFYAYKGGLAVLSPSGFEVLNDQSEAVTNIPKSFGNPALTSRGNYMLAYDAGGQNMLYLKNGVVEQNTQANAPLVHASINAKGRYALVTEQSGSKATATVYSEEHQELFKWISSERYITLCDIAPAGDRLVLAGIKQNNARIVSSVSLFSTSSEQPLNVWEILDEAVLSIEFLDDKNILVICETEAVFLSGSTGEELGSFSFNGLSPATYVAAADFIVLRLVSVGIGESSRVVTLDFSGEQIATVTVSNVSSLAANDTYIGILTSDSFLVYNKELVQEASGIPVGGAKQVVMRPGREALIITSSTAQVYEF